MSATVASVQGNAGLVLARRNRRTGLVVSLYDSVAQGIADGTDEDKWATVCEDHGGLLVHRTRALAESAMWCAFEWCPTCNGEAFDPHGPQHNTEEN